MNKSIKKITASIFAVAAMATGMLGISAHAARQNFWFSLNDKGGHEWSYGNPKDDNEQQAYIHTLSGSVNNGYAPALFTLYKSNNNSGTPLPADKISDSVKIDTITGYNNSYKIPYTVYRGTGQVSYIYASAGYYGTSVNGYWYS